MSTRTRVAALLPLLLSDLGHAVAAEHTAPAYIADVPFSDCRGLICVKLALDDAPPRTLMLDTGNVSSVVIADVAQQLGWKLDVLRGQWSRSQGEIGVLGERLERETGQTIMLRVEVKGLRGEVKRLAEQLERALEKRQLTPPPAP